MARGLPGVWSALIGLPLIGVGAYVVLAETQFPATFGYPYILFGGFVLLLGLYIHIVAAPEGPTLREGEEMIATRQPIQRASTVKVALGFPILLVATYLFLFTRQPYVYPTVALVVGLYLFSTGLQTYWANSLTTYYLTNERVIREYRLVSLVRQEVPLSKVRGVEERKSLVEAMVGLGNIRVASGAGSLQVVMANIRESAEFADRIRERL